MKLMKCKSPNIIWPQREYFIMALIVTPLTITLFAIGAFDDLPLSIADMPLAYVLADVALLYLGTTCFKLNENGVVQYNFFIETRCIPWSEIDQVGTGYTGSGAAIVITLKRHKRFTPMKDSGRVRDADMFFVLHRKGCILIRNAKIAKPLVTKFYGELDFEWNPPDNN